MLINLVRGLINVTPVRWATYVPVIRSEDRASMSHTSATLLFIPHTESQPRATWSGDPDERPLQPHGRQQAAQLATAIGSVDAIYSSPARRCVQTVEPLASASAIPIALLDELREAALQQPQPWDWYLDEAMRWATHGASVVGRVLNALDQIQRHHPHQRVALCSHGDTIPVAIAYLAAHHGIGLPTPIDRGGWYEMADGTISAHGNLLHDPSRR
jgi:8-oxo-dGTP diphosphatase